MWRVKINRSPEREMRKAFSDTLIRLMAEDERILALDADLGDASDFSSIRKARPERFIEMGIAEANMIGVAAGLSMLGFVPFVHSFGPFASRRVGDQVYMSGAYAKNTLNIYASDPGICAAANGGTHSTYEDLAFMRALPESMVFEPADAAQLEWLIRALVPLKGVHYIRANRKANDDIYESGSTFEIGKGNVLRSGDQVLLISMGSLLGTALAAAETLAQDGGISVEVIDMFTLKPLDEALILQEAKGKSLVATLENHSVINGLGSAVADVLAQAGLGVPLRKFGNRDQFGQVGSMAYLQNAYGMTEESVCADIRSFLEI